MTLLVNDLELDEELDTEAMRTVFGGNYALRTRQYSINQAYLDSAIGSAASFLDQRRELQRRATSILTRNQQHQSQAVRKMIS